jgi:dipeptidase D
MVCEKNEGTNHDFKKDPIQLVLDGKYIKANQTSLGADDGMGMSHALLLGVDKSLKHGPIELLFTVGEEIGLIGALNLEPNLLKGKYMINIDSSIEAGVTVGRLGLNFI